MKTEDLTGPAEVCLEDLSDVHTRWHAERIEHDLDRSSIRQVRHIFLRKNTCDNALVTVASGHLVTDAELTLHRDKDLDHLDHARRQFVALLELGDLFVVDITKNVDLTFGTLFVFLDLVRDIDRAGGDLSLAEQLGVDTSELLTVERVTLLENYVLAIDEVFGQLAAVKEFVDTLVTLFLKDTNLVIEIAVEIFFLHALDIKRTLVLILSLAGKDLNVNDRTVDSRRAGQRSVFNVAGLFTEDGTKKFFFRRQLRLALRRNFTDQDRARFYLSTDTDDARFIEIAKHVLADIRDITRDLLRSELCIPGFDLEFLDVDRRVVIVLDHLLGYQNSILKVVTTPWHKRHEHVTAESEFAAVSTRAIGDDHAFGDAFADRDDRTLVDTGVLIRTLEFHQRINIRRNLTRDRAVDLMIGFDDDAFGVDKIDRAVTFGDDHSTRIASRDLFHTGADKWRLGTK